MDKTITNNSIKRDNGLILDLSNEKHEINQSYHKANKKR